MLYNTQSTVPNPTADPCYIWCFFHHNFSSFFALVEIRWERRGWIHVSRSTKAEKDVEVKMQDAEDEEEEEEGKKEEIIERKKAKAK